MWQENLLTYIGIVLCLSHAGMFSGLNLAFFSISRIQLEVESSKGDCDATRVLALRNDANFLLATILWANVAVNVLLTLLSDSVMTGVSAFIFSTVFITLFGEITPQAYFSRNALRMASLCTPVIHIYQVLFFIVAKPTALVLDAWLGKEGINYLAESQLETLIRKHIEAEETEVTHVEGIGALNFLQIDELPVTEEGEVIHPDSVLALAEVDGKPVIPAIEPSADNAFLQQLNKSGCSWAVLTDKQGEPVYAVDANACLRSAIFEPSTFNIYNHCYHPIVITDNSTTLGEAIWKIKANKNFDRLDDSALEYDVLLIWSDQKRIITGADIFGRLLKGIIPPADQR